MRETEVYWIGKEKLITPQSNNPYMPLTQNQILDKLEKSRLNAEQGNYRFADDILTDMRSKHGFKFF